MTEFSESYLGKTQILPSNFRLCGNTVGNTRQFISATNELHLMFRSEFSVPLNVFTGQPNVPFQLVGFRAQVSTGKGSFTLSENVFLFVSLLNVNIELDSLSIHLEAMSLLLSFSHQYKES